MIETLYNAKGKSVTRVKRAFNWVVTFRDFPVDSWQTVDGDSMMTEAFTLFTKGRAEFYLDGVKRGDRVPGIMSSEHEIVGQGGTFKLVYVEPTTRVCIPTAINKGLQPNVSKVMLKEGDKLELLLGYKGLVCSGAISIDGNIYYEERTFKVVSDAKIGTAVEDTIILDFTKAYK
jgi:hypothetical protein